MDKITYNNIQFYKIKDFDRYYISKCGKVLSTNYNKTNITRLMIPQNRNGYKSIRLYKNSKAKYYQIHRLIGQQFIPNPNNKPQINHIDSIRNNNNINNLEWCDNSHNQKHAYKYGFQKVNKNGLGKFGKLNGNSKKVYQYDLNGSLIKIWDSMADVNRELGVLVSCISNCCSGKIKTSGGFIWKHSKNKPL
jgi:hypothetical protein